jgi:hypothetical protein
MLELGKLTLLKWFVPSRNSLTGWIPKELCCLTKVKALCVQESAFSQSLCIEHEEMTSLVDVKLGVNSFAGPLPSELGKLKLLEMLDLSNLTMVNGSIPP